MPHAPQERPPIGLSSDDRWEQFFENQHDQQQNPEQDPEEDGEQGEGGLLTSTARGVGRATNEVSDLVVGGARAVAGAGLDAVKGSGLYKMFGDDEEEKEWLEWYENTATSLDSDTNPYRFDIADRPAGLWGAYEAIVQFGTGFIPAMRAMKGVKFLTRPVARATAADAVAGFTVFDPHEERFSDLVESGPLANPLTAMLASDEDDSEIVGRLKNAAEGLLLGVTVDALIAATRVFRAKRGLANGRVGPEEAAEEVDEAVKAMDEAENTDAFGIRETEDGQYQLELLDEQVEVREGLDQRFNSRPEAERAAASFNLVHRLENQRPRYLAGRIELDGRETALIRSTYKRFMEEGMSQAEAIEAAGERMNLGRIETSDDVVGYINAITRVFDEDFTNVTWRAEEGKGVSHAETIKAAEGIFRGVSGAQMVQHLTELEGITRVLPQTLLAVRMMVAGQGERVARIGRAVDLDPTNAVAVRSLWSEIDLLTNLTVHLGGITSDVGRALNAAGIDITRESLERAAKQGGADTGETLSQKVMSRVAKRTNISNREVAAFARTLTMTKGDHESILKVLKLTADATRVTAKEDVTLGDRIVAFRASMMLSGPKTHATNLLSSLVTAFSIPAEHILGGIASGNATMTRQGWDMLTSPAANGFLAVRQAFSGAVRALKENRSILDPRFTKNEKGFQTIMAESESGFWMNVLGAPTRALVAGDEFVKRLAYLSHVRAQSMRMAREDAAEFGFEMSAKEMQERVFLDIENSLVDGNGAALWANSLEHARYGTFTRKLAPGTVGHGLQEMANNNLGMRILLPFVRTPVNIMEFGLQRFPATAAFNKEMRDMWKAGGEQRAMAQGRVLMGSLMYSTGAMMAHQGLLTGNGPEHPALRAQLLESGWQPYSAKIGNKYISYRRLEPLSTPIGIMADWGEMSGEVDAQTMEEAGVAMAAAMASSVSSKTFLIGLVDFFEAVGSGEEFHMQNFLESFATSFATPALVRQGKDALPERFGGDLLWRESEGILQSIKSGWPGFSKDLEPRRNIFGEPVYKTSRQAFGPMLGSVNAGLNPFTVVDGSDIDDIQYELSQLGKAMSMPRDRLASGRIRLRDGNRWENRDPDRRGQSPYDRWMEITGEMGLRDRVTRLMRSSSWQNLTSGTESYPGGLRHELVNDLIQSTQEVARLRMLREYPDLREALNNERISETEALFERHDD